MLFFIASFFSLGYNYPKRFRKGIFASLIASSTLAAGTVAVEKASEAVAGVAVALTGTVETAVNNAASAIGNTAADIAEEAKKAIEKELSKIADIDLFKIDIKETLEGYKIKILENLSIDLSKPIGGATEWVVGFTLETTGIDLKKVKNVIDFKTLENIKAISNNIYTDIVRKIVSGDKPSEILNIVDCINTNTKEFKIAYDRLGDVDKAYEIVNKIKDGQFLGEIVKETTNYNDYKNFYGNKVRISKISDKTIKENIVKYLNSTNVGDVTEAKVANYINNEMGLKVEQFRNGVSIVGGRRIGDIDVTTAKTFIEVKTSWGVVKADQFDKYIDPFDDEFFNFENKKVILYVDKETDMTNLNLLKKKEIEGKGVIIVNSLDSPVIIGAKVRSLESTGFSLIFVQFHQYPNL